MDLLRPISALMSTDLVTVSESDALTKVDEIFRTNRFHHIPVVQNKKLIGIISKSDYQFFSRIGAGNEDSSEAYKAERLEKHKASEIMITGVATLPSTERIATALKVFKENLFHSIPIVDDNKLVCIIKYIVYKFFGNIVYTLSLLSFKYISFLLNNLASKKPKCTSR